MATKRLQKKYENVCMEYIKRFEEKHEMDFDGFVGNQIGGIACFGDLFLNFTDIVYDINSEQPKHHIISWYWDNVENSSKSINYYSYTMGLRVSQIEN